MSEYKYNKYDNYENDKLVYSNNDTKYKTYNNCKKNFRFRI